MSAAIPAAVSSLPENSGSGSSQGSTSTGNAGPVASATSKAGPVRKRRKSDGARDQGGDASRKESLTGALARALVGTLAFVFRAPVRLFRPVKLSSWSLLEAMAQREGRKLSFRYMQTLIRREKSSFLPHLLVPPLLVNTTIGFCLFEAYSLTESHLIAKHYSPRAQSQDESTNRTSRSASTRPVDTFTPLWIVAVAGGAAGAAQCIVSAPLDNVRIVLTSNINKPKRHSHTGRSSQRAARISWMAVARAAILPFAPEITHSKMMQKVKESRKIGENNNPAKAESQRIQWEKRIKRWRGGVHGAGLIMSLARDSVGFSAFFVVFEISRRLAFHASISVDRVIAYFNTSAALPVGRSANTASDDATIDDTDEQYQVRSGDISYSRSRTKTGRIIAALVLVIGGAIGAAFYEVVGRPAELMRLVVWEGRKAWEEGRRPKSEKARTERPLLGRQRAVGARVRPRVLFHDVGHKMRSGGFLDLRSGNTTGSTLSRVEALRKERVRRPPHPLKLTHRNVSGSAKSPNLAGETTRRRRTGQLRVRVPSGSQSGRKSATHSVPSLSNRPSAYSLLLEHALRTSSLRYPSSREAALRIHPTPVPTPILLFHTYFIAPFSTAEPQHAKVTNSTASPDGTSATGTIRGRATIPTSSAHRAIPPHRRLLNLFNYRYPESNAPGSVRTVAQAQTWGSGRLAWALRRLASPYGVGFMVFAWMSGDLAA